MNATIIMLAWKSIRARASTAVLTILAVALSVALLTGVEKTRHAARASFETTISGVDSIVGGRTGPINLLLFSVFRMGDATTPISWHSYEMIAARPDVAWAVPLSMGDSHRGFGVLGTTPDYFEFYRYGDKRNLRLASGVIFDPHQTQAVIGAAVADELGYAPGDNIILSHGLGAVSFHTHDAFEFEITGVLKRTGTPVDRTIHVSLESIERIHAPPSPDHHEAPDSHEADRHEAASAHEEHAAEHSPAPETHHHMEPAAITAVLVGLKSRPAALSFTRSMNVYRDEPLLAIMPGLTLSSLWSLIGNVENILSGISIFVVLVGIATIMISILTSLNERRREMAILRAIGARPAHIFTLILSEAAILAFIGAVCGLVIVYAGIMLLAPLIETRFGLSFRQFGPGLIDAAILGLVPFISALMALWPSTRALQTALSDGMSIKN